MNERRLLGLLGTLVIVAITALGLWAFVSNYGLDPTDPAMLAPTLGALGIAVLFVLALSGLGSRAGGGLDSTYW